MAVYEGGPPPGGRPYLPEGIEPIAWFSRAEGYIVYASTGLPGAAHMVRVSDRRIVHELPSDAIRLDGGGVSWGTYEAACLGKAAIQARADTAEERIDAVAKKIVAVVGGDWAGNTPPLEVIADALIHVYRITSTETEEQ